MRLERVRGLMEVSQVTGIPYYRIIYAEHAGHLPKPRRVACKRIYNENDVARIKAYFGRKEGK